MVDTLEFSSGLYEPQVKIDAGAERGDSQVTEKIFLEREMKFPTKYEGSRHRHTST